ncbi:MAG: hypothetical protein ACK5O7_06770 [Holosporales bacterium]
MIAQQCPFEMLLPVCKKWHAISQFSEVTNHFNFSPWREEDMPLLKRTRAIKHLKLAYDYPSLMHGVDLWGFAGGLKSLLLHELDIQNPYLISLLQQFKYLEQLQIMHCKKLTEKWHSTLGSMTQLQMIHFANAHWVTDTFLSSVAKLTNVTCLRLPWCGFFTTSAICNTLQSLPQLEELNLHLCAVDTSEVLQSCSGYPLEKVNVRGKTFFSERNLKALDQLPHLRQLAVTLADDFSPALEPFLSVLQRLEAFDVYSMHLTNGAFKSLSQHLTRLNQLNLHFNQGLHRVLENMPFYTRLDHLALKGASLEERQLLNHPLDLAKSLNYLDLRESFAPLTLLLQLGAMTQLQTLHCPNFTQFNPNFFSVLRNLTGLKTLGLRHQWINFEHCTSFLPHLTRLRSLDIRSCEDFAAHMGELEMMTQIRALALKIHPDFAAQAGQLYALESLQLHGQNELEIEAYTALAKLSRLRVIFYTNLGIHIRHGQKTWPFKVEVARTQSSHSLDLPFAAN